ncbi:MAG TPA: class II aldolase [Gammaproteobacteria bacterium]|nr:class II aldolase [Gammaproteobacteria bacterium]|tara:strand:- start:2694 stop:3350 length:657 start_codon:yes stop_codon:yes gene_type:complete
MVDVADEATLREQLVEQYIHVERIGLNELASGNLSVRLGDNMLISPSGATADNINVDTLVECSLEGEWEGDRKPSSEWRMHAAIYQSNEKTQAVVHTHSDYCVAMASNLKPLPGFHYLVGSFGGTDVPCVPYSTFGTQSLGDDAAAALQDRSACLLGKHGMIAHGRNIKSTVDLAHRLEIMCRQYVLASQVGEPEPLTDEEWAEFFDRAQKVAYGKFI